MRGYETASVEGTVPWFYGYESPCGVMSIGYWPFTCTLLGLRIPMRGYEALGLMRAS